MLCFFTGTASSWDFAAATAYTFLTHPVAPDADGPAYPLRST